MNSQRGFSLIAVVFILVVLAALGAVIAQISATQHLGSALGQDGKQAWYAVRAGLEWGRYQAQSGNSCSNTLTFEGFEVEVTCTLSGTFSEGSEQIQVYALTSTASRGTGTTGAVSRQASMNLWRPVTP